MKKIKVFIVLYLAAVVLSCSTLTAGLKSVSRYDLPEPMSVTRVLATKYDLPEPMSVTRVLATKYDLPEPMSVTMMLATRYDLPEPMGVRYIATKYDLPEPMLVQPKGKKNKDATLLS